MTITAPKARAPTCPPPHAAGERTPPLARIAVCFLPVVDVEAADVRSGWPPPPPVIDAGRFRWAEDVCREARASGRDQDVHCRAFTPHARAVAAPGGAPAGAPTRRRTRRWGLVARPSRQGADPGLNKVSGTLRVGCY